MAEINKAQKRQSGHNKSKYAAQYGVTFNNKRKAIAKHIANLEAVLKALEAVMEDHRVATGVRSSRKETKANNIKASIIAAQNALKSIPLKK